MNAIVTTNYHPQLPAFMQRQDLFDATDKAIAGIGGGIPPYISIKASKWRLVDAAGDELMVNQLHLDVIVLGGNEHVSKTYYAGSYDPAGGNTTPPTCFSDNGSAPSSQAMTPQAALCAQCPHNAWGSKVSEISGKDLKACGDSKRLAVVLAVDTPYLTGNNVAGVAPALGQVYLLRVPAASMRTWRDYAKEIRGRGIPIMGPITRLQFDPKVSYPSIVFSATAFVTEPMFQTAMHLMASAAFKEAAGTNDVPRVSAVALPAAAPAHLAAQPLVPAATQPVPAQQIEVPSAAAPAPTARKPGRPPKDAVPAAAAAPAPAPSPLFPAPVANGVIQVATASSPDLDALLAATLRT